MQTIKVQLNSIRPKTQCSGIEPRCNSLVSRYCRKLLEEKDGDFRLEVYRGNVLAMICPSAKKTAKYTIRDKDWSDCSSGPRFVIYKPYIPSK